MPGNTRSRRKTKRSSGQKPRHAPRDVDRRALEGQMWELSRLVEAQDGLESADEVNAFLQKAIAPQERIQTEKITPLDQAQELMYRAWDSRGRRRVQLAHQALQVSPDCADAYVLLAEETARSASDALALYTKGVAAGERALGEELFESEAGRFWGLIETRPYMRAREGLAECLWAVGRRDEAIAHYQAMIHLNPNDNQGIRYMLASCLLEAGRYEETERLIRAYKTDDSAAWLYSKALLAFCQQGKGRRATLAIRKALEANINVPAYLLGLERPPKRQPSTYTMGDKAEAWSYLTYATRGWTESSEALTWLLDEFEIGLKKQLRNVMLHLPGFDELEDAARSEEGRGSVQVGSVLLRPG